MWKTVQSPRRPPAYIPLWTVRALGVLFLLIGLWPAPLLAQEGEPVPTALITYHVHPGDALSLIADRHGIGLREILRYNHLPDPDFLAVGQPLRLPVAEPLIVLDDLRSGDTIASPLALRGHNSTGDARIRVRVFNERWHLLGSGLATNDADNAANWSAGVAFRLPEPGWGYVEISSVDATTGRERNTITCYVYLAGSERPPSRLYTVQPGDTLTAVAERFGVNLADLRGINNILNPDHIRIGATLIIPDA